MEEEKCAKMRCFVGIMQHTAHVAPEVNDKRIWNILYKLFSF